jgi:hypothetical protein
MLLFQYCGKYISSEQYTGEWFDQRIYLDRIAHDRLQILDNKAELRVMVGEQQSLSANAASNVDNQ